MDDIQDTQQANDDRLNKKNGSFEDKNTTFLEIDDIVIENDTNANKVRQKLIIKNGKITNS